MADLASYDYRELGRLLRERLMADGRGWRVCGAEMGVTATDLSRIVSGQSVSAPKALAACDWLGVSFRSFYQPSDFARRLLHVKSTETEETGRG